jgi:hypothetical protein
MVKKISVSVNDWVYNELLKNEKNKSSKIEEALIKTFYKENNNDNNNNGITRIMSQDLHSFVNIPSFIT